ncbi:MAG: NACHT domain-containing protein, partial [Gammaproteobacteria bacterium]
MLSRDKIKLKFQKTPPLLSGQSDSDDFLESVVHIIDNGESQEEVNSLPSDASSNQQASFMRLHSSEEKNNLSNHYDEGMQVHAQVSSSIAQVEVSGVQQESFLVFAEQQYLREHVELREIFAKYGREYQEILLSASNGDEEVKMERPSPRVFFSYAWPILSMFPHEWWHQLFLVSLREDLRELFGIDAYVDIMDSIDNPVRYMIENFSSDSFEVQETRDQTTSPVSMVSFFYGVICFFYQFFSTLLIFLRSYLTEGLLFSSANVLNSFSQESFDAQADDRHRTAINNQQSNKLICMVGSQSFVRKCTNDRFVGSMVRYEKVFIQSCISRFTNSGLPLEQMPVMALSLGNYQDCILPNFQGSTNAYESHRYSYYQFLQAILYKLFLCTSGTAEQNNECKELLNRMRCDPILGSVFERRGQEFKYYYRDTHLFQDVQVLRNKYNLPHWLNGELENVLKIWRSMISKESLDLVSALSSNAQSNSFLDFMDSSSIMMNDFALIKDALAKRYLEASKIRLFEQERPVPLEKQYVNLVIVKEQEQRSKDNAMKNAKRDATEKLVEHHDGLHDENEGLLSKDEVKEEVGDNYDEGLHIKNPGRDLVPGIMKHYEDIHTPKEEIDVENIFKGSNLASEQKILKKVELLGRAGVGKTTLSYYLTYRWALGLLWQNELEWIFHFSLKKMMSNYDRTHIYSMSDVLFKEYLHSVPGFTLEKANEFWKFVLKNPSKVLFVLDGYDEVVLDDHPVIEMLLQEAPRFLVTSRPYARIKQKADLVLENIGFTEKNIKTYITRYFIRCDEESQSVNKPLAESDEDHPLWEWLENHETVKMMCKIPINAELICQLWLDDAPLFQDAHVSVGDLYRSIFNKLIKRYLAKQPEFEREINQMPDQLWLNSSKALNVKAFLKRVAFQGIKNNILIIDYTVIKEVLAAHPDLCKENDILLQLAQSGLLKSINDDVILSKQSFYFIHYSFQEYLAGCYIADTIEHRETQDFIRKNKFYPAYQWVMVYAASSMKNQIDRLDCFYDVLLSPPRDLYGQRELELLLRCGEAACWPREWKGRTPLLEKIMDFLFQDGESFESLNFIPRYIVSDCFQAFLELKDQDGNQGVFEILKARNAHDPHAVLLGISDLTYDIVLTDSEVDQVLRWVEELIEQDDMDAIKWFFQEIITYVTLNQSQVERTLKIIESIIEKSDYPSEIIVKDLDEENVFSYLSFDEAQWSRLFDALENKLSSIGFQEMLTFLQGLELSDFQMDRVIVWFENFFVDWVGKNRFIQCCKKSSELRDFSEAMSEFFSCIELTSLQLDRLLNVFDACLFFETQALMVGFLSGVEFNAMQVDRVIGWIEAGWRRADSFWFDSTSEFFKSIELTSTQL